LNSVNRRRLVVKRPVINISHSERGGRILIGLLGVIGGVVLLGSASGAGLVVLEVLLVVAGLDMIVTGALGHCPLYKKLGHVPSSLRRPT
jgi:hypothetical protein